MIKYLALSITLLTLVGCKSTQVIYVPESEKVESIIHNGVEGYFVPKAKMTQLVTEHIRYKYYLRKYGPIGNDSEVK